MARGRMVSTTIATDKALNSLSLEAELLYLRAIPHLDRDGLIVGDDDLLIAKIAPRRQRELFDRMEPAIQEWIDADLVIRYESKDCRVLFFSGFNKNNKIRYDQEGPSNFPPPPGYVRTDTGLTLRQAQGGDTPTPLQQQGNNVPTTLQEPVNTMKDKEKEKGKEIQQKGENAPTTEDDADDASSGSVILDLDFALVSNTYENNIGLLSPIIADSLKDDIKEFSASWVVEAIGIAVKAKKSDLRYVEGILKRWKREGKDRSRTNGRDSAPAGGSDELARGYDIPEGYEDLINRPWTEPASSLPDPYTELLAEADRLRGSKDQRAITLLQRKLDNLLSTAQLPVSYDDALSALAQRLQEAVP